MYLGEDGQEGEEVFYKLGKSSPNSARSLLRQRVLTNSLPVDM